VVARSGFALVLAVLAAGCGGGGGDRLSEEEFQEQANAICARFEDRIDELGQPQSIDEVTKFVDEAIPVVNEEIGELEGLEPPEELEDEFDRMLAEARKTVQAGQKLGEAAESRDEAALRAAIEEGEAASNEADEVATKLGLDACVDDGASR
jgi:hypothetical protein